MVQAGTRVLYYNTKAIMKVLCMQCHTVPHDDKDEDKEEGDIKVMASHAIFRMDAGKEAPGCVVGFQFTQQSMYKRQRNNIKIHAMNLANNFLL